MDVSAVLRRLASVTPAPPPDPAAEAAKEARETAAARGIPAGDPARIALSHAVAVTPAVAAMVQLSRARRRAPSTGCVLVAGGPRRSGLTCAGCWLLMRCYGSARRVTLASVLAIPKSEWSDNVAARAELREVRTLFVDDVGRETADARDDRFLTLLADRAAAGLATVVATHTPEADFIQNYLRTAGVVDQRFLDIKDTQTEECGLGWWAPVPALSPANIAAARTLAVPPNPRRA